MSPQTWSSLPDHDDRSAALGELARPLADLRGLAPCPSRHRCNPSQTAPSLDHPGDARPGSARTSSAGVAATPRAAAWSRIARAMGWPLRASSAAARARRPASVWPFEGDDLLHAGRPCVSVPVLSKATAPSAPAPPGCPALHQHAAPRRCGEGGDDGDRRGDDERARAGEDEQDQRAVNPCLPVGAEEQRGPQQHRPPRPP